MKQRTCLFVSRTVLLALVFFLGACQPVSPASLPSAAPSPTVVARTATPSPIPTITFTASPTPTVAQLIFPYTLEGLRQHDFQSGRIHIRSTLDDKNQF